MYIVKLNTIFKGILLYIFIYLFHGTCLFSNPSVCFYFQKTKFLKPVYAFFFQISIFITIIIQDCLYFCLYHTEYARGINIVFHFSFGIFNLIQYIYFICQCDFSCLNNLLFTTITEYCIISESINIIFQNFMLSMCLVKKGKYFLFISKNV